MEMELLARVLLVVTLGACGVASADPPASGAPDANATDTPKPSDAPRPRTHAHNDYEHPHPLFDALHEGFVGVEADVYLVGGDLRVSHNAVADWSKVPTLQASYLSPLRDLVRRRNNGGVYADGTPLLLLVDVKTDAEPTYARLHQLLAEYQAATPGLFTTYTAGADGRYTVAAGAITVVVSGNRPREAMKRQATRLAGYDGRVADVGRDAAADTAPGFMPLVSDNWNLVFKGESAWDGTGPMPAAARARLAELVAAVHGEGKQLRFWNLPKDAPAVWGPLWDAGVDLINTDDLAGLSRFVASRAGQPKAGAAGPAAPGAPAPQK
jgi:hypothetical protein